MISSSTGVLANCYPRGGCVEIYLTRACTGSYTRRHWSTFHPSPQVYNVEFFSVRFYSGSSVDKLGFRLLYSFHQDLQQPVMVEWRRLECSGLEASIITQHVRCSILVCASREDKDMDACPLDLCGPSVVSVGETCGRIVLPPDWYTLQAAQRICQNDVTQWFIPSSPQKWSSFVTWARAKGGLYGNRHIPVWLKLSGHSLPAP